MRVKMITLLAGPERVLLADKEYDLYQELGEALCEGGYAVEVKQKTEPSAAEAEAEALEIPGVDEAILQEMAARGFRPETLAETSDEALLDIPGLGPATLKKIRVWSRDNAGDDGLAEGA